MVAREIVASAEKLISGMLRSSLLPMFHRFHGSSGVYKVNFDLAIFPDAGVVVRDEKGFLLRS